MQPSFFAFLVLLGLQVEHLAEINLVHFVLQKQFNIFVFLVMLIVLYVDRKHPSNQI